jgi:hypothetical protein
MSARILSSHEEEPDLYIPLQLGQRVESVPNEIKRRVHRQLE